MEEILVPIKRKRVVLTLEQKLEVIKLKDEGKLLNFNILNLIIHN